MTRRPTTTAVIIQSTRDKAMKTLAMMKLVGQGRRDLEKGKSIPHATVLRELRKKLLQK